MLPSFLTGLSIHERLRTDYDDVAVSGAIGGYQYGIQQQRWISDLPAPGLSVFCYDVHVADNAEFWRLPERRAVCKFQVFSLNQQLIYHCADSARVLPVVTKSRVRYRCTRARTEAMPANRRRRRTITN